MTLLDTITNFIVDARYRVAVIGNELDKSRQSFNSNRNRELEKMQSMLVAFLGCIYVDRFSFYDSAYNFLTWTSDNIVKETEYLRYFCEVRSAPQTPITPFSPFLYSPQVLISSGGHIIEDEGVPLMQRSKLNFVGVGVTASDDSINGETKVVIPSGGLIIKNIVTTTAPIVIDMANLVEVSFIGSASIGSPKTWTIINVSSALLIPSLKFTMTTLDIQTFPANFMMGDARWNAAVKTWTPLDLGTYEFRLSYDGTNWLMTCLGGPYT